LTTEIPTRGRAAECAVPRQFTSALRALVAFVLLAAGLAAQVVPPAATTPGWQAETEWAVFNSTVFQVRGFAIAPPRIGRRDTWMFVAISDRIEARNLDDPTRPPHVVHTFAGGGTAGWIGWREETADSPARLWFTRFAGPSELRSIDPFAVGFERTLRRAPVPNNTFDIAVGPSGLVLASASPAFPAPGAPNGIWLLDPDSGSAPREILRLQGPSGPIAFDANGDLLCVLQSYVFPPPPGSIDILRFSATRLAQLAQPGAMPGGLADATVVESVDGAHDLVVLPDGSRLISDAANGRLLRTGSGRSPAEVLADGGAHGVSLQMQFVPTVSTAFGPRWFEPNQPAAGAGALFILTSDFVLQTAIRRITPRRPRIDVSPTTLTGPGTLTWTLDGFAPGTPVQLAVTFDVPGNDAIWTFVNGLPAWRDVPLTGLVFLPGTLTAPAALPLAIPPGSGPVDLGVLGIGTGTAPDGSPSLVVTPTSRFSLR
jgi:hypothetical protein